MRQYTILILGDHDSENEVHAATREAVLHAAAGSARDAVVNTRWLGVDDLQLYPGIVAEAAGVVLAPPGPRSPRILPVPKIRSLSLIRERDLPLLATGESHGLVLVELAREVLGLRNAGSTRFEEDLEHPVVSAVSTRHEGPVRPHPIEIEVLPDPLVAPLYGGPGRYPEVTDLAYGLNPDYAGALASAGLRTAGVDPHGGRPYLQVLDGRRFHVTAAYLPQLRSRFGAPHPLFSGLMAAALSGG